MNFLAKLFSKNKISTQGESFSTYLGGDGLTEFKPVFINCASNSMASSLIERFISEKHGEKNIDWVENMSMSLSSNITECGLVKCLTISSQNNSYTYYFDLSRPMKNPI